MKKRVINLLNYLGLDHDTEVVDVQNGYDNTYLVEGKEYMVLTEDEADSACECYIENFIDDLGIKGFTEMGREYIVENCIDKSWFDEAMRESFEFYVDDISKENTSNKSYKTRLEEEMADTDCKDKCDYVEYLCSQYEDGVDWYKFNFGEDVFYQALKKNCDIDISKMTEFCIEVDGRGHILSSYDGNEIKLDNDYYAYRIG